MISRRMFLKSTIASVCACHLGGLRKAFAATGLENTMERTLRLYNVHTGERIHARYWIAGNYIHDEIDRIHHFLRCHYTNIVKPISIEVIELLSQVTRPFTHGSEINIISGYRSPQYNDYLRSLGRQVSGNSLHLDGLAIDFAIPGVRTSRLARQAVQLQAGGVGRYPEFVHIDVGRVRRW